MLPADASPSFSCCLEEPSCWLGMMCDVTYYMYPYRCIPGSALLLKIFQSNMLGVESADMVELLGKAMDIGTFLSVYIMFNRVDLFFHANVFPTWNQKKEADVATSLTKVEHATPRQVRFC